MAVSVVMQIFVALGVVVSGFLLLLVIRVLVPIGMHIIRAIQHDREFARLQDTRDLQARIERWAANYTSPRRNVRLAIGVIQRGQRLILGSGRGLPPDPATPAGKLVYEIGSVTKVFTGILLAKLANEGLLQFDDCITKCLPANMVIADALREITLRQLATHTSGLPRLPTNMDATVKDNANPYAQYDADALYSYLRGAKLDYPPGTSSDYSNLGMGLLGHLLALKSGRSYEELVRDEICVPLGMNDTAITLTSEMQNRLVPGCTSDHQPTSGWDLNVLAPAGGIKSTVDDMLRFLEANMASADHPLGDVLATAQGFHGRGNGLGWCIQRDKRKSLLFHWHNGGTGGYISFVGMEKSKGLGVVLLSNYGDAMAGDDSLDWMGFRILATASKVSLEVRQTTG